MITTSNSPVRGSGTPNQLLGVLLHTIAISGLSRVRTELFYLLVIPSLAPHPIHPNRESTGHRDLGDLPPSPHRQVEVLAAPFLVAAHRHLRRFHQQFSATACNWFMIRVRACTMRCRCHSSCRRSRFSQLGTQIRGKRSSISSCRISRASWRSVFCLRTRLLRIAAASPMLSSNPSSESSLSNQRACPLASIPTRTSLPIRAR